MASSYPTATKSFTTKVDGNTISASHVNDAQDEIVAIETALLDGFTHDLKPSVADAENLGTASLPWGAVYVSGLPMDIGLCEGRLTLTTAVPVTTADVTAATSIFFTPYKGNRVALYDGTRWALYAFTELTLALGTITSGLPYDVFLYNNAGTLTLELLAWTNGTTRATALVTQNGVLVKTGATTRRYLGTFYTTSTTTTEDSFAKRFLWNYYNRVRRPMRVMEATDSWVYSSSTIRQARATATNQLEFIVGVAEGMVEAAVQGGATCTVTEGNSVLIGLDSTTAMVSGCFTDTHATTGGVVVPTALMASVRLIPVAGYHYLAWLERSGAAGVTTWYGDQAAPTIVQNGIHGSVEA